MILFMELSYKMNPEIKWHQKNPNQTKKTLSLDFISEWVTEKGN